MEPWPQIPADVVAWFRSVFAEANRHVCERLVNVPNIRETSLDDGLIEALIPDTAPLLLPSGAIVRMDAHNIGGLRRLGPRYWDMPPVRRWGEGWLQRPPAIASATPPSTAMVSPTT
jgi:hypothetical protein